MNDMWWRHHHRYHRVNWQFLEKILGTREWTPDQTFLFPRSWLEGGSWGTSTKWGISKDSRRDIPFPRHFHKLTIFPRIKNWSRKLEEAASFRDFHKWGISKDSRGYIPFPRHFHKLTIFPRIKNPIRKLEEAATFRDFHKKRGGVAITLILPRIPIHPERLCPQFAPSSVKWLHPE